MPGWSAQFEYESSRRALNFNFIYVWLVSNGYCKARANCEGVSQFQSRLTYNIFKCVLRYLLESVSNI